VHNDSRKSIRAGLWRGCHFGHTLQPMPAHSKFTEARRRVIIEHLVAGNSRRRAAAAAQIDHETLSRWLKRGEKGAPGGRWRSFFDAVQLAEAPTQAPILVPLTPSRPTRAEVEKAWRFLERSGEFERPEPVKVEVVHSPVTAGVERGDPA
jgi:hypothetical protein